VRLRINYLIPPYFPGNGAVDEEAKGIILKLNDGNGVIDFFVIC
jgi:hypothetical protein